jgi:hypothetical protein
MVTGYGNNAVYTGITAPFKTVTVQNDFQGSRLHTKCVLHGVKLSSSITVIESHLDNVILTIYALSIFDTRCLASTFALVDRKDYSASQCVLFHANVIQPVATIPATSAIPHRTEKLKPEQYQSPRKKALTHPPSVSRQSSLSSSNLPTYWRHLKHQI